jgi:hypothetical protein
MTSTDIYSSEKILPYVYLCTHKENGTFYIGSRTSNKLNLPSHKDILKYKTSSDIVKPRFEQFNTMILAEFFDPYDAYVFEQELILENFKNPLILNMAVQPPKGKTKFLGNAGRTQKSRESASKRMKSDQNPGKHQTKESKLKRKSTLELLMSEMSPEEKSLKYGNFGDKNSMYGKSIKEFMHQEEFDQWKESISNAWISKESIWMHNFLNKNARIDLINLNEALAQGYVLGYAEKSHTNYTRSVVTYKLLTPAGKIIEVGNLSKFYRDNNVSGITNKKNKSGYVILSKIRN